MTRPHGWSTRLYKRKLLLDAIAAMKLPAGGGHCLTAMAASTRQALIPACTVRLYREVNMAPRSMVTDMRTVANCS
eukprot:5195392-Amphidinium_carterae.1